VAPWTSLIRSLEDLSMITKKDLSEVKSEIGRIRSEIGEIKNGWSLREISMKSKN